MVCGIFLDQGSNLCPLHWQVDSQPLRHQGSPKVCIFALTVSPVSDGPGTMWEGNAQEAIRPASLSKLKAWGNLCEMTVETWTYFAGFPLQNKSSDHCPGPSCFKFLGEGRTVDAQHRVLWPGEAVWSSLWSLVFLLWVFVFSFWHAAPTWSEHNPCFCHLAGRLGGMLIAAIRKKTGSIHDPLIRMS